MAPPPITTARSPSVRPPHADSAGKADLGRNPVAVPQVRHIPADLDDCAPELVTERQWRRLTSQGVGLVRRDQDVAMTEFLQVGATDAAGANLEDDLTRAGRRLGNVDDPDVVAVEPPGSFHAVPSLLVAEG